MRNSLKLITTLLWLAPASALATPILNVDSNGQLLGASNVDVNGMFYIVEFVEGNCFSIYDNCNEDAFTFSTQEDALAASAALLDQVFTDAIINGIGNFDSFPFLTRGCTSASVCEARTPYEIGFGVNFASADNSFFEGYDTLSTGGTSFADDKDNNVWTVWTVMDSTTIPEPSTISLLTLGLVLIAFTSGRRQRPAARRARIRRD